MQKKILFVSWTGRNDRPYYDPSTRYRCFNFAHELNKRGNPSLVISQIKFQENLCKLSDFDFYVFHRPYLTEELAEFLTIQSKSKTMIADHDDFIFDIRYSDLTPAVRVRGGNPSQTRSYIARNAEALNLFENFTCSTEPLKKHIKEINPLGKALTISNSVDQGFIGLSRIARKENPITSRPFALGYFSGTATHDKDFLMIAPILREYLKSTSGKLLLVGPVKIPEEFSDISEQIYTHPIVSFHELSSTMAKCKTVLAPLENTIFTNCKSGLKFFEAALAGCNVIATPIPDIDRFDSPLLHKCKNLNDWWQALNSPTNNDPAWRELEAQKIETLVSTKPQIDKWLEAFAR